MVNFQIAKEQKKNVSLEDISSDDEELKILAEQRIKRIHHHDDGSEVKITFVEPSEFEGIVSEGKISEKNIPSGEYGKPSVGNDFTGSYSSGGNSKRTFGFCACGHAFNVNSSEKGMQVSSVNDYSSVEDSSQGYSSGSSYSANDFS